MNWSWSGKGPTENQMYPSPDELHSPQEENKKAARWFHLGEFENWPPSPFSFPYHTGLKDLWGWRRRLFSLPLSWVFPYSNSPPVRKGMSSPWKEQDVCIAPEKQRGEKHILFPIEICGKLLREMLGDLVIGIPYSMGRLHFFYYAPTLFSLGNYCSLLSLSRSPAAGECTVYLPRREMTLKPIFQLWFRQLFYIAFFGPKSCNMIHISVSFFNTLIGDFLIVSFFMRSHWRGAREITTGASAASASNTRLPPYRRSMQFPPLI